MSASTERITMFFENQASSGSWWWTGKPGMQQSTGLQRVGHDWVAELNWRLFLKTQGNEAWGDKRCTLASTPNILLNLPLQRVMMIFKLTNLKAVSWLLFSLKYFAKWLRELFLKIFTLIESDFSGSPLINSLFLCVHLCVCVCVCVCVCFPFSLSTLGKYRNYALFILAWCLVAVQLILLLFSC